MVSLHLEAFHLTQAEHAEHSHRAIGLFAKAWDPGKVKTRLARTLGHSCASQIYLELLTFHLRRFGQSGSDRTIVYSPNDDATKNRFEALADSVSETADWSLVPQVDGDLGVRMSSFFQQKFEASGEETSVVVVGSDAPQLTCEMVDEAFEQLENHDVVFGPSTDGGYYLVGLSVMAKQIFEEIQWSTEHVLQQSLVRCESAGLSVAMLAPLTDIDEESDLRNVVDHLRNDLACESNAILVNRIMDVLGEPS